MPWAAARYCPKMTMSAVVWNEGSMTWNNHSPSEKLRFVWVVVASREIVPPVSAGHGGGAGRAGFRVPRGLHHGAHGLNNASARNPICQYALYGSGYDGQSVVKKHPISK